ncbi:Ig-like domain repeat protein [Nocardioides soli]|uniref:Bacterial Ig-like domain-containing protein n=1 Tax=Nocardioides soli TaxID=1036020 RepID=A0A7W4VUA9_9ACTN|nr:Ig-like domain repeat protein [Nocardioides soli]MBB3041920.1 hypothetical protein [Nocardioides soli]
MSARKSFAGALAAVVAGSALVMTASPASAAYTPDPDDPGFTPVAADLIGAGSDTTQHAMKLIADVWNADASHGFKIASYAATSGGTIPLPGSPEITRPNGSGAGKGTLYNPSNPQIDFARSSDKLSATESNAGLKAIPFALDTVVTAVSNQTPSNAPATLSAAQLVSIYKCESTTWNQVGGASGATIKPYAPQSGSGTAKFFKTTLVAANGGTDFNYGVCVTQDDTVQEHDDTLIKGNANAIVPISKGRAELKGGTVRVVGGFAEKRALYNVVRSAQATDASLQAVFGENGFVCSAAAAALIKQAGFEQLATPAHSGACGTLVDSTSNFTVNQTVATTTGVSATSTTNAVKVVAKVSGSTAPSGSVSFYEGATLVQGAVPLVSGQATLSKSGVPAGAHTYRAVYVPNDSIFLGSEGTTTVTVSDAVAKAKPAISESFPAKVKLKKKAKAATVKGVVTVKGASGKVTVKKGKKTLKSATLKNGKASVKLAKLSKGTHKLTIAYAGDATHLAGKKTFTIKVVKAKAKAKK